MKVSGLWERECLVHCSWDQVEYRVDISSQLVEKQVEIKVEACSQLVEN